MLLLVLAVRGVLVVFLGTIVHLCVQLVVHADGGRVLLDRVARLAEDSPLLLLLVRCTSGRRKLAEIVLDYPERVVD